MIPAAKAADALAVTSAGIAGGSWLAQLDTVVSIAAGVVALIAGATAIRYHRALTKKLRETEAKK